MKQLVAIGGSMHGQLIEIDDRFGPKDGVVFALTDKPLPATPPKLQDLPEPPAEAYRIGCIEFEPGRGVEYLIETRLSGEHALRLMLSDVELLAAYRRHHKDASANIEAAIARYA